MSVQAQASAWLARLDGSDPSPQDLQAFKQWVNEAPSHVAAFEKVTAAWEELNVLTQLPSALEQHTQRQRHGSVEESLRRTSTVRDWFRPVAMAATLVIALMLGFQEAFGPLDHATYQTSVGEQKTIRLPDGSVVQLNTNSRFRYYH